MRVAFASRDLTRVDVPFGWAPSIVVYDVGAEGSRLARTHLFEPADEGGPRGVARRLAAVADCDVLYAAAIEEEAAASLQREGIRLVKTGGPEAIDALLARLAAGPGTPWPGRLPGAHGR
jgi:nitrogen fixation protein NifX